MTEENTQDNQVQQADPQANNVNISVEQILAAILSTIGATTVPLDNLVANYGGKQIAVNQNEDKSVHFALVDAPAPVEETTTDSEDTNSSAE